MIRGLILCAGGITLLAFGSSDGIFNALDLFGWLLFLAGALTLNLHVVRRQRR